MEAGNVRDRESLSIAIMIDAVKQLSPLQMFQLDFYSVKFL